MQQVPQMPQMAPRMRAITHVGAAASVARIDRAASVARIDRTASVARIDRAASVARIDRVASVAGRVPQHQQFNAIAPAESRLETVMHSMTTYVKSLALPEHPMSMLSLEGIQSYVTHYVYKFLALPHGMPANALPSSSPMCDEEDVGDWL
jgi:hypothetical protein